MLTWAFLLAPFLTPAIIVGYGWQMTALALREGTAAHELLYALLLVAKLAPAAAVVLHFAPRAISGAARHCHALVLAGVEGRARRLVLRAGLWLRGEGAVVGAAAAVVFLLAFAEFEIASLVNLRSTWTVALFEAHAGGMAIKRSFALALGPLLMEIATVTVAGALLLRAAKTRDETGPPGDGMSRPLAAAAWVWLAAAALVATVFPALVALEDAAGDPGAVFRSLTYAKELAASVGLGLAAGGAAFLAAGSVAKRLVGRTGNRARRVRWIGMAGASAAPGLVGALVLALSVLALFQLPGLRALYDTPLPVVLTVTLLLLPFGILLRLLVDSRRPAEGLHLARMLAASGDPAARGNARGIIWSIDGRRRAWVAYLLFAWGYFDMTASSILAPSRATPVFATLYNFMHYGRKAATSAMVAGAFAAPLVVLVVGGLALRAAARARG